MVAQSAGWSDLPLRFSLLFEQLCFCRYRVLHRPRRLATGGSQRVITDTFESYPWNGAAGNNLGVSQR